MPSPALSRLMGFCCRAVTKGVCARAGTALLRGVLLGVFCGVLCGLPAVSVAQAQPVPTAEAVSLRSVIAALEAETPYRFLYRDALVAGVEVAPPASEDPLSELAASLASAGLRLVVDPARYQVLVAEAPVDAWPDALPGTVVDAADGQRLPYATLTWRVGGALRGVTADASGAFVLPLPEVLNQADGGVVTASYVGYAPREVVLTSAAVPSRLDLRLVPAVARAQDVVVVGSTGLQSHLDTSWHRLVQPTLFSPLGERSVIRALQPLPAVAVSPAFSEGLHVRGSTADAFQVTLDGMPIYGQSHFFGLFDAFNDEALQAVSLYYDVAPAVYAAPPGGTLAFHTRTGSQTRLAASAGLSNVAARATAEGPLGGGRGSWLLSGRHSTLNTVSWLGTDALLAMGLDVERPTSDLRGVEFESRILRNGAPEAAFFDLHGKLYLETPAGTQLTASGYLGGDDTRYDAERLRALDRGGDRVYAWQDVTTESTWGNGAATLEVVHPLGTGTRSRSQLALTTYHSTYRKDDFLYRTVERTGAGGQVLERQQAIAAFGYDNTLAEWKASQHVQGVSGASLAWKAGLDWHHYRIDYREGSARRTPYGETERAQQLDVFGQADLILPVAHLEAGLRTHFLDTDGRLRISPRLRARLQPEAPLSASAGLSRTYQYLHRLSLQNTTSAHLWVLTADGEPPSIADQVTAGLYTRLRPQWVVQAEVYAKRTQHVRQHETSAPAYLIPRQNQVEQPWFSNHTSWARGVELMQRVGTGGLEWTTSYALSRVELRNPALNGGAWFRADWDRRHQVTTHLRLRPDASWTVDATWTWASGTPNVLAYAINGLPQPAGEPDTLPAYHRLDLSLAYARPVGPARLHLRGSLFNVYDRLNVWYRDTVEVLQPGRPIRPVSVNVDVYDLGLQPSFDLTLRF